MRIQFITHNGQLYGANQVLLSLVRGLKEKGHDISIILPTKKGLAEILEKENINYSVIPCFPQFMYIKFIPKYFIWPLLIFLNLIVFPYIAWNIKRFKPDIIYSNTSAENLGIIFAKLLNIKHISHVHEFALLDKKVFFIGGNNLRKKYINKSDGVIFVSKITVDSIIGNVQLPDKHSVIYNGLEDPYINIEPKILTETINFALVGVFTQGKGQDVAVEYFNELVLPFYPGARLHLFGDKEGIYKKHLVQKVKKLGLESNIIFHGFVQNTNEIYDNIDILLVFSKFESFGLVTIEAMLRGVPVIGYDSAGTAELITDRETGYLFFDKKSFSTSLFELLSNDNYNNIRERALLYARSTFSKETYCNNIEKFLIKIINE